MKIPSVKDIQVLKPADKIPPGWYTREECEREWKVNQSAASKLIRTALNAKKCEMRKFLIYTASRGLFPTPYYRFK